VRWPFTSRFHIDQGHQLSAPGLNQPANLEHANDTTTAHQRELSAGCTATAQPRLVPLGLPHGHSSLPARTISGPRCRSLKPSIMPRASVQLLSGSQVNLAGPMAPNCFCGPHRRAQAVHRQRRPDHPAASRQILNTRSETGPSPGHACHGLRACRDRSRGTEACSLGTNGLQPMQPFPSDCSSQAEEFDP